MPIAAAALLGLIQGSEENKSQQAQKQSQALRDAAMIRYSPWSKIDPNKFADNTYTTPSATTAGLAGASSLGQAALNVQNGINDQAYKKQIADYYSKQAAINGQSGQFSPYNQLNTGLPNPANLDSGFVMDPSSLPGG